MSTDPRMRFIRLVLYKLKRDYGNPIDLYRPSTNLDVQTGKKNTTRQKIAIQSAIVLPGDLGINFSYGHSFLAADRNFAYGGKFGVGTRYFIIDCLDLPDKYIVNLDDYLIWNHKRYEIKVATLAENNMAYTITGKEVEGGVAGEVIELSVYSSIRFTQKASTS